MNAVAKLTYVGQRLQYSGATLMTQSANTQ